MEKESTLGLITGGTRANGERTKCTVKELSHGSMAESTSVNMPTTKRRAMENSCGQMAGVIEVSGLMANNTAREHTSLVLVKRNMENGKTARESDG